MARGESVEVPTAACVFCGEKLDRAMCTSDDGLPSAGDITICIGCNNILVFTPEMQLRRPTSEEIILMAGNKHIVSTMKAVAKAKALYRAAKKITTEAGFDWTDPRTGRTYKRKG